MIEQLIYILLSQGHLFPSQQQKAFIDVSKKTGFHILNTCDIVTNLFVSVDDILDDIVNDILNDIVDDILNDIVDDIAILQCA